MFINSKLISIIAITVLVIGFVACGAKTQKKSSRAWFDKVFRCNAISFTQKTGTTHSAFHGQAINQCNEIPDGMQTTISVLKKGKGKCSYKLIGYSGQDCQDGKAIATFSLNSSLTEATLNKRRPICSYKLGKHPRPGQSVKVIFGGGNIPTLTHDLSRSDCYNLCGTQNDDNFPNWVGVYNDTGSVVKDNYIELYSELSCGDGSIVKNAKGKTTITKNKRLSKLTLVYPKKIVASYKILRVQ